MKAMTLDEVKEVQYDLLLFLDDFCRRHGIDYSLAGGSLLGAIRHKGFIPWDDDIDIILVRDEYERLVALLQEVDSPYHLHYYKTAETYQPFSKFYDGRTLLKSTRDQMYNGRIGVHVDIFPIDLMPDDEEARIRFLKAAQDYQDKLAATGFPAFISGSKWYYQLARLFLRLPKFIKYHGKNKELAEEVNGFMSQYKGTDMQEAGFLASRYGLKEHFPKSIFEAYEDVAFESANVRKILDHDTYLRQLYGDYMQFPPESQRNYHRFYKWYWKEED